MIEIDFKIDEEELLEDLSFKLEEVSNATFVLTMFMMPMRIVVNQVDLLDNSWADMPIMNIASNGLLAIQDLKEKGETIYSLPEGTGDIVCTMLNNNDVELSYSGFTNVKTIVTYDELERAFRVFADKVRKFLWERAPQMNNHPYWGPWLRGERD